MKALIPQETYRQISDISLDYLINDKNIKGIIFDFDGTLLIKRQISEGTINFIKNAKNKNVKTTKCYCTTNTHRPIFYIHRIIFPFVKLRHFEPGCRVSTILYHLFHKEDRIK